jgi:hypothetical protein
MNKTIFNGTRQLVKPHLHEIRKFKRLFPESEAPKNRRTPTALHVWKHYVRSMITSQQLISDDLWTRLNADARWRSLGSGGPKACPSEFSLAALFGDQKIRFPKQKAARIRTARNRDFEGLATLARSVLREHHDRRARRETLRREEVRLAVAMQAELGGCGVAPKIARLALRFIGEFDHLVPIDSRWQNALGAVGVEIEQSSFSREASYFAIEEEIARAAYSLGVSPVMSDGAIFGWLGRSIAGLP